jgi:hypothetical protein
VISQAKLGSDLQTEVAGGLTRLTAFAPMIGRPDRTLVEHGTGAAGIAIKDRVEGTVRGIVRTEDAMVEGFVAHGAGCCQPPGVELKPVSPHDVIGNCRRRSTRPHF